MGAPLIQAIINNKNHDLTENLQIYLQKYWIFETIDERVILSLNFLCCIVNLN